MALNPEPYLFHSTELKQQQSVQFKQYLLDKYFVTTQHQFDEQFVKIIFEISKQDSQVHQLIQSLSLKILNSKQKSAIHFLQKLIHHSQYHHQASIFLQNLIQLKNTIYNLPLLLYILRQLPILLNFLKKDNYQFIYSLITFLSLKMRSFDLQVKIAALQALKQLGNFFEKQKGDWEKVIRKTIPMMIQKQQLVRQVSYIKGLFLQMLQDQFHQVRILTIQCLGIFRVYIRPEDLKQIIIYMLNDEHQLVRQKALQTAKTLNDLPLGKQDLSTLLMCLKEKRTNLRRLVYESLAIVRIIDFSLILLIVEKVQVALLNYRSDKKHIYRALFEIGRKYFMEIGKLFSKLGLNEMEEPNCKNIYYKAKMVLCHACWKRKQFSIQSIKLPTYFIKHMLYISDVEAYLFQSSAIIQEEIENSVDYGHLKHNFHHLVRFIECEEDISQKYHKILLEVTREMIIGNQPQQKLLLKLKNLQINFNLGNQQIHLNRTLQKLIKKQSKNIDQIMALIQNCIKNRQYFQQKNVIVPFNKCTISRLQPNLVISSKCQQFINRVFLKCWKHINLGKQRKIQYKKISELSKINENEASCFWYVNLTKYNQIQCILLSYSSEQKILDSYDLQSK